VRTRRRTVVVVAAVVVAIPLVLIGRQVWQDQHPTGLSEALDAVPRSTLRLAFTDWAAVRKQLGVPDQERPSDATIDELTSKSYDSDLSAASSIDESTAALQKNFGFSPATVEWEAYAQSPEGATMVVRLPDDFDFDQVTGHLEDLGFTRPSRSTGVWQGGVDLVAAIDPTITPELQYVALDRDASLVLTSDSSTYLTVAMDAVRGEGARATGLDAVVGDAGTPLSSVVYDGDYACGALAMAHAGGADRAQARQLLSAAGEVNPYSAFAMSDEPDGSVRVAFEFADEVTARTNADTRATLARGPAPGQGGTFGDRFRVTSVTAQGSLVVMHLAPRAGASVLSDLSTGPVLFAAC